MRPTPVPLTHVDARAKGLLQAIANRGYRVTIDTTNCYIEFVASAADGDRLVVRCVDSGGVEELHAAILHIATALGITAMD